MNSISQTQTPNQRFQSPCRAPGCIERTALRGGYCDKHAKDNPVAAQRRTYDHERKQHTTWRLYGAAWERLKVWLKGQGNVQCQKLTAGYRCTRPVEIFHHLISPKVDPTKMYVVQNVIGLCRQCHPPDEGTPHWKPGEDFVPTQTKGENK